MCGCRLMPLLSQVPQSNTMFQLGIALWSVLTIVRADYIIDDRDNRVGYSSGNWAPVTELGNLPIGSSQAYDLTA